MLLTVPFNKALTLKSTSILSSPLKVKNRRQLPPHLTLTHCKHVINQFLSLIFLCCETTVATFATHCGSLTDVFYQDLPPCHWIPPGIFIFHWKAVISIYEGKWIIYDIYMHYWIFSVHRVSFSCLCWVLLERDQGIWGRNTLKNFSSCPSQVPPSTKPQRSALRPCGMSALFYLRGITGWQCWAREVQQDSSGSGSSSWSSSSWSSSSGAWSSSAPWHSAKSGLQAGFVHKA